MTVTSKDHHPGDLFAKVIAINVYGTLYAIKYCASQMAKQKALNEEGEKGAIITVSSVAAYEGQRGQIAYSASKGAIVGMTLPMARELG
jgi:3-hydroxyacyl-CoA dehydrogenase/3-hydroxy-2-methylbutyryl-CoA dehydrogenase